jgi:hypothetical protein
VLGIFLFTTASRTTLGPTQPPIQWVPGALSLGVRRPGRKADHSPPSSAEELYFDSPNTSWWRGAYLSTGNFTFTLYIYIYIWYTSFSSTCGLICENTWLSTSWSFKVNTGAAEKRAIINQQELFQALYLRNYKNIILKCITELITFWTWRLQGDIFPCANTPLTSTPAVPEKKDLRISRFCAVPCNSSNLQN